MIGAVGMDANGDAYMSQLAAEGVDTRVMRRSRRGTGTASIQVCVVVTYTYQISDGDILYLNRQEV
jgi:sugar/nucleoside kinase (ribokinase family)